MEVKEGRLGGVGTNWAGGTEYLWRRWNNKIRNAATSMYETTAFFLIRERLQTRFL